MKLFVAAALVTSGISAQEVRYVTLEMQVQPGPADMVLVEIGKPRQISPRAGSKSDKPKPKEQRPANHERPAPVPPNIQFA